MPTARVSAAWLRPSKSGVAAGQSGPSLAQQDVVGVVQQARRRVQGPGIAGELLPAGNGQAAVLRIDRRAHACRALVAEQQRRTDFEIFDGRDRVRMPGRSGRQSDLGESGTRENSGLTNDMVGEHRIQLRIELVFPGQFVLRQRIAEQRVQLAPINQSADAAVTGCQWRSRCQG
jgi:hypothetical protein